MESKARSCQSPQACLGLQIRMAHLSNAEGGTGGGVVPVPGERVGEIRVPGRGPIGTGELKIMKIMQKHYVLHGLRLRVTILR